MHPEKKHLIQRNKSKNYFWTSLSSVLGHVPDSIETNICVFEVSGKYTWEQYL